MCPASIGNDSEAKQEGERKQGGEGREKRRRNCWETRGGRGRGSRPRADRQHIKVWKFCLEKQESVYS